MKIQERRSNQPATSTPIATHNNMRTSLGIVVASVLTTLGLVGGGYWIYQRFESKQANNPLNSQTQVTKSPATTPNLNSSVPADSSVQAAFGGKANVKILSVYRIEGQPDLVNVEMQITRRAENNLAATDTIDPGATEARNINTSETYLAVNPFKEASKPISLLEMRPQQSVNAYAAIEVPIAVREVDIFIPNVGPFRKIAIANSNSVASSTNFIKKTRQTSKIFPVSSSSVPLPPPPVSNKKALQSQVQTPAKFVDSPATSVGIQPGEFVSPAYGSKAQVELLSVKRIVDPKTGKRDVVNVQMRIRRLSKDTGVGDSINVDGTTARDRQTSQAYKSLGLKQSTGSIFLREIRPGASGDAYVWLRVPENVKAMDIYVPETQAFKNVAIAN